MSLKSKCTSYYKLDETTGTVIADSVGNNDGTIVGASYNSSGKINGCRSFDGSNDYISLPKEVIDEANFAISFWCYNNNTTGGYYICDNADVVNLLIWATGGTSSSISCYIGEADTSDLSSGVSPYQNFNNIVISHNSSGTYKVFINNIYRFSKSGSNFTGLSSDLYLGNNSSLTRPLDGYIDEVAIFNGETLTDGGVTTIGDTAGGEVAELYNSGSGIQYPFGGNTQGLMPFFLKG